MPDLQLLPIVPSAPQSDSAAPRASESESGESFGKAFTQAKTSADENARVNTKAERAVNAKAESAASTKEERVADSKSKAERAGKKNPAQPRKGAKASRSGVPILPAPAKQPGPAIETIGIKAAERAQNEITDGNILPGESVDEQTEGLAHELVTLYMAGLQGDDNAIIVNQQPETETDAETQGDSDGTLNEGQESAPGLPADNGAKTRQGIHINEAAIKTPLTQAEKVILKDAQPPISNPLKNIEGAVSDKSQAPEARSNENQNVAPDTNAKAPGQEAGNMSLPDAAKALSPHITQAIVSEGIELQPDFQSHFQKDSAPPAHIEVPRTAPLIIESALPQLNKGEAQVLPEVIAPEAEAAPADGTDAKGAAENTAKNEQPDLNAQPQLKEAANDIKDTQSVKSENAGIKVNGDAEVKGAPEKTPANAQTNSETLTENKRQADAPPKQPEQINPPAEQASKPVEQAKPIVEQAKQPAGQVKPTAEQTKQPAEQVKPTIEKSGQPIEQAKPAVERATETIEHIEQAEGREVKPAVSPNQPAEQIKAPFARTKAHAEQAKPSADTSEQAKASAEQAKPPVERVKTPIEQAKQISAEQPDQPAAQANAPVDKAALHVKQTGQGAEQAGAVKLQPQPQRSEGADDIKHVQNVKNNENVVFKAEFNLAKDSAGRERGAPETAAANSKAAIAQNSGESHFALTNTGTNALNAPSGQPIVHAAAKPFLPPHTPMAQLEGSVRWLLRTEAKGAEIQLHPANLGRVTVQIKVEGSEVHARVWATEASTLPLLKGHRAFLETSLKEQGLTLSSFDLQHGRGGQQAQGESQRQHQHNTHHHFAPPMMETWTGAEFRQELPIQLTAQRADDGSVELYA